MSLQGDSGTLKRVGFLRVMMMMGEKMSNMTLWWWWELEKARSVSAGRAFEE
jgi:hypothetical protein